MLPYIIIFSLCCFLNAMSKNGERKILVLLSCLLLSLLAGFRDLSVGTDTNGYPELYFAEAKSLHSIHALINLDEGLMEYDKGFLALAWFGLSLSEHIWMYFFLIELVITCFLFLAFIRLKKHFNVNIVIFTLVWMLLQYNYSMNAMRQLCALSISFYAISFMLDKKWIFSIIWILIAYSFHSSTLIILVAPAFYIVSHLKDKTKRHGIIIAISIFSILFLVYYSFFLNFGSQIGLYQDVYINRYGIDSYYGEGHASLSALIVSFIFFAIIFISYKSNIVDKRILAFHFLVHYVYTMSRFLSYYSAYAYRIGLPFLLVSIYFFSLELSHQKISSIQRYAAMSIIIVSWMFNSIVHGNSETVPYTSAILGIFK